MYLLNMLAPAETADGLIAAEQSVNRINDMISSVWDSFVGKLPTIIIAIIVLAIGMIISKIVLKIMGKAMDKSKLDVTIGRFAQSAARIVLNVFVIIIALTILGVPMESIIAVIATAGVAVGLALQNSLSNLAGGFLILIEKPFRVGSFIKCSGEEGTVERISILYTKLTTPDNKTIFIPNGVASSAVLVNYSDEETRRIDLNFGISYEEDLDRAIQSINKAIEGNEMIIRKGDKAPFIRLSSMDASSVGITVRLWGKASDYWDIYFDTIEAVRRQFLKDNIDVPYNKLDVNVKNI